MSGTTGTIPLQTVVANQTIASALWNGEFANIASLLDASGAGGHSDTDADAQLQTAPYPGSVLSKATSIAGELERLRYVIAQILGKTYWYQPAANGNNLSSVFITGEIRAFGSSTVPTGFLACDGTSYLRADYPDLFIAIGTTWGNVDGTHFNVPDLRGKSILGSGTGTGLTARAVGDTGGEETHLLTTTELPSQTHNVTESAHAHSLTDPGHYHSVQGHDNDGSGTHRYAGALSSSAQSGAQGMAETKVTGITLATAKTGLTVADTNGDGAHNNMQPWACVGFIIKT